VEGIARAETKIYNHLFIGDQIPKPQQAVGSLNMTEHPNMFHLGNDLGGFADS